MSPTSFFLMLLSASVVAFLVHAVFRHHCQKRFDAMAAELKMHYAEEDRFQLTPRVREQLPPEMSADLVVKDVLYYLDGDRHRYLFTIECITGDPLSETRFQRAATFCETLGRNSEKGWSKLRLAQKQRCLFKQYLSLTKEEVS